MPRTSRQELERALALYNRARDEASTTGDWSVWADRFTPDARYVENAYGGSRAARRSASGSPG